jgi:transcriptional regulator with XRE-family HTH domain
MRKALRFSGTGVSEMADYLGVTRGTISTWINGRIRPSVQTLRLWALQCGVDYEWLAGSPDPQRQGEHPDMGSPVRKPGKSTPLRTIWRPVAVAA